jgi:O-antigen ligase
MFKFKNPAVTHLLLLYTANTFNDFAVINLHIFPSPTQVVILYGYSVFFVSNPLPFPREFQKLRHIITIYLGFIIISCIYVSIQQNALQLIMFTIGANVLWLIGIIPLAYQGIGEDDMIKFFKIVLIVTIIFVAIPGFYEFITGKQIIVELEEDSGLFYLKGFTSDKLEFGNILACGIFISLSCLFAKIRQYRRFFVFCLVTFTFLIVFSFSTTSVLGLAAGLLILFYIRFKRNLVPILLFLSLLIGGFFLVRNSTIFQNQIDEYNLKYTKNINQASENNFRYLAVEAGFHLIPEQPILGHGANSSGDVIRTYLKKRNVNNDSTLSLKNSVNAHDFFINELIDYGLVGFCLLFAFVYSFFKLSFKKLRRIETSHTYLIVLKQVCVCLSMYMIFRFVLYYHRFDQTFYFVWIVLIVMMKGTEKKLARVNNRVNINDEAKQGSYLYTKIG